MPDPSEVERLGRARAEVLGRIAAAAGRAGRDPRSVTLVAVTKTVPPERVAAAVAAGLTTLGENRVQEAAGKVPQVGGAAWHLVGPLQSNKARSAVELFDVIETVDSLGLATLLDRLAAELHPAEPLPVLVQVNVDRDPAKSGYDAERLATELGQLLDLPRLRLDGLMTVGRQVERAEDARPTFVALRQLRDRLRRIDPRLGSELSMGMSDDYEIAVEEGATIVRVGRALFGERPSG